MGLRCRGGQQLPDRTYLISKGDKDLMRPSSRVKLKIELPHKHHVARRSTKYNISNGQFFWGVCSVCLNEASFSWSAGFHTLCDI